LLLFFLMMEGVRAKYFEAKQGKKNG
jgi:hypothetical protein